MAELRSTTDGLHPISKYVLTVHAPTKWDLTDYETTGTFGFQSRTVFIPATTPFHVPHVGDEISVAFEGKDWLGSEDPTVPHIFVVTRVSHRIEASASGITCKLDVYTEQAPRPETGPDETKRGRSDT